MFGVGMLRRGEQVVRGRSEISLSDRNGASNENVSSTITTRLIADTPFD
jgi:hypothetical protein